MVEASLNPRIPADLFQRHQGLGQEHVFRFINELTPPQLEAFLCQLEGIDLEKIIRDFGMAKQMTNRESSWLQPNPLDRKDIVVAGEGDRRYWDRGLQAIKEKQVAVVTLAGGQGTRLGSLAPKGCYDVGLPSKMSLFELQALRLRKLAAMAGVQAIPWYIMTSNATHNDTKNFFKEHGYFRIDPQNIAFFKQDELPAVTEDGKLIMQTKGSLAMSPNGNGGVYSALIKEGILEEMKCRGIKYIHMFCVDNVLVRVADPFFLGACIQDDADCGSKTIVKEDPKESVGLICKDFDDKMIIAEYSELEPGMAERINHDGSLVFNQANIANHFFTVNFLERVCSIALPIHLAYKKIPSIDEKGEKSNDPLMGYKLETFIFDIFRYASKSIVYQGNRAEEFAPLKNAPGNPKDSPEYCRQMLLNLHQGWLIKAGAVAKNGVEISPLVSYAGEGLERFKDQIISGFLKE